MKTKSGHQRDIWNLMLTEAPSVIAKIRNQPVYLLIDKRKKIWYMCTHTQSGTYGHDGLVFRNKGMPREMTWRI